MNIQLLCPSDGVPPSASQIAACVCLNDSVVEATSAMDAARFQYLWGRCCVLALAQEGDDVAGFALGMDEAADYPNEQHAWFQARLERFLYVDRIVVDERHRGKGVGAAIYQALVPWAKAHGAQWLCGEINLDPPNPRSIDFHARLGFSEMGQLQAASGKLVSMQQRAL